MMFNKVRQILAGSQRLDLQVALQGLMLFASFATVAQPAIAIDNNQIVVASYTAVGEPSVRGNINDQVYEVRFRNQGTTALQGVTALVSSTSAGTTIIAGGGPLPIGNIAAGATVTSPSKFLVRTDRTYQTGITNTINWKYTSAQLIDLGILQPAQVYSRSLAELGIASATRVSGFSGGVSDALIREGTVRFATRGDSGADQQAQITVSGSVAEVTLFFNVLSARPTSVSLHEEAPEDGSPSGRNMPALEISGLAPGNAFGAQSIKFRLPGAPLLDFNSSDGIVSGLNNASVGLKRYWTYDASDSSFSISAANAQQLLSALPAGTLYVSLSFVSQDASFAPVYDLIALKPQATLTGSFVLPTGGTLPTLNGRKVLLRGFNSNIRREASVDANGAFAFGGLIPDIYQVTLLDLDFPNHVIGTAAIYAGTTNANLVITYGTPPQSTASFKSTGAVLPFVSARATQNGMHPTPRTFPNGRPARSSSTTSSARTAASGTGATFQAIANADGAAVNIPVSFTVPSGTSNVGVQISVSTDEYPYWTGQQSQYNDTWSYDLKGLPGNTFSDSGQVNQTHYS